MTDAELSALETLTNDTFDRETVDALIAEVRRLRAQNTSLKAELARLVLATEDGNG